MERTWLLLQGFRTKKINHLLRFAICAVVRSLCKAYLGCLYGSLSRLMHRLEWCKLSDKSLIGFESIQVSLLLARIHEDGDFLQDYHAFFHFIFKNQYIPSGKNISKKIHIKLPLYSGTFRKVLMPF